VWRNSINQQLAAVRRLAYEAADSGLLSPELANGISRVRGFNQLVSLWKLAEPGPELGDVNRSISPNQAAISFHLATDWAITPPATG